MLKFFIIYGFITFLFSPSLSFAEGIPLYQADELTFKQQNGVESVYNKKGELFSGAVELTDAEGRKITYIYKNGQKNGVAASKFKNEQIELEITFADGKKNGEEIMFTENGTPKYRKTYKNNQLNGEYIIFYSNGKPQQTGTYVADLLDGEVRYFDSNGNIERIINYKKGVKDGAEKIIINNMLREENIYKKGKLNGISKKYNDKYLTDEITYLNGVKEGKHTSYAADRGRREVMYKSDMREGLSAAYFPNQKLAQQTNFSQDKKNGQTEKWNKEGILRSSETYKNNQLHGIGRYFDEQGYLQLVTYYINGNKLAEVNIEKDKELDNIYNAYLRGVLNEYSAQKNLWYKILWLGLNLGQSNILQELKAQMQMYGEKISEYATYQRSSGKAYEDENRDLFFGLSPLGYAVSIDAPVEILQIFTESPKQLNEKNPRGTTILEEAIRINNPELLHYLLLKGADIKAKNANMRNILFTAIEENAGTDTIAELLKSGAEINAIDNAGNSPLLTAIKKHNKVYSKILIENGADVNFKAPNGDSLLQFAYKNNAPEEILDLLIENGADVNAKTANGELLLILALKDNNIALVKKMLTKGANINKTDAQGNSALSYVLQKNANEDATEIILEQPQDLEHNVPKFDAMLWQILAEQNRLQKLSEILAKTDVTKPDINGVIPQNFLLSQKDNPNLIDITLQYVPNVSDKLMWQTVQNRDAKTLQKLIEKDGNVEAYDEKNKTLLIAAIENDDVESAEVLLKNGANINVMFSDNTPLVILDGKQTQMTELLLLNGADVNYVNSAGQTVLMNAVKKLNLALVNAVAKQDFINLKSRDNEGNSAIHYLAQAVTLNNSLPSEEMQNSVRQIATRLIEAGADINEQNANGETVLILLAKQHTPESIQIISVLESMGANADIKDQYGRKVLDYIKK
ncbi:MAG: ankyrin repeat domain-containing protein [Alphaproteobacteria bacterium]|nr:ankyrin repeat domain-containing protein [Alphaproteobacteria bacterium]